MKIENVERPAVLDQGERQISGAWLVTLDNRFEREGSNSVRKNDLEKIP